MKKKVSKNPSKKNKFKTSALIRLLPVLPHPLPSFGKYYEAELEASSLSSRMIEFQQEQRV